MKIAVLNASSQKEKNPLLFAETERAVIDKGHTAFNLGIFLEEEGVYSYVQMALLAGVLLESKAVDFIVTGCSSGQGMMLACNSLPGVLCGYVSSPAEAYLFGQINGGNAVSFPLGLDFGWGGELNLRYTLEKLFSEPFGGGYPKAEAGRKLRDAARVKTIRSIVQRPLADILPMLDRELVRPVLCRKSSLDFLLKNGKEAAVLQAVKSVL